MILTNPYTLKVASLNIFYFAKKYHRWRFIKAQYIFVTKL